MATPTGVNLLSALRRAGSTSAMRDVPDSFFVEDDEKNAFAWLRDHVTQYRAFPDPGLFRHNTGIQTLATSQPLSYYMNEARKRALYSALTTPFGQMRDAMEVMNPDGIIELAREMLAASTQLAHKSTDYVPIDAALHGVIEDYKEAAAAIGLRGITCGWEYIDEQTGGWQKDDLISVVGRIGVGKTYVLLFFAYCAWRAGYSVLFNTNELGVVQLARRLFGVHSRINPNLIRKGVLSTAIARTIEEQASAMTNGIPFNIISGGFKKSVETVAAVAEATSPDIIFVDAAYLLVPQKKRRGSESRRETVSDTIEGLKTLAIDLNRPIVQSVQFNRQAERKRTKNDNRSTDPTSHLTLANIAETDVIGQASSIVFGLAKAMPPHADDRRWLRVMKGREGEAGVLQFNYTFSPVNFDIITVGSNDDEAAADNPTIQNMI